jgi:hypothetical protein
VAISVEFAHEHYTPSTTEDEVRTVPDTQCGAIICSAAYGSVRQAPHVVLDESARDALIYPRSHYSSTVEGAPPMPNTPRSDRARDLLVLARDAMHDLEAARDLDWYLCWQIRLWEAGLREDLAERDLQPAYGLFDFHRMEDICYLVRNRVFQYLSIELPVPLKDLPDAAAFAFYAELQAATKETCNQQFRHLSDEIVDLELPLFMPCKKEQN